MKHLITLTVHGGENKDKLVLSLINSGYLVHAELKQDYLYRPLGWEVEIYEKDK